MNRLLLVLAALLMATAARAQSSPGLVQGQVPTPTQWNSYFAAHVDVTNGSATNLTMLSKATLPNWATAGRPGSPASGSLGYNSTSGLIEWWNGSAWVSTAPSLSVTDGTTTVSAVASLTFSGCTVSGSGGSATATCSGATVNWPTTGDLVLSNSTNTPAGLAPVNGDCVLGSGGVWTAGSCGGSATITITDSNGNTVTGASTLDFGPGFLLSGGSAIGVTNLNQSDRTVTTCSGTPSPCIITANDLGGQVNFNGSSLTATLPAITSVTPTASASTTALTLSSGTGVSIGDQISDGGVHWKPGTIITAGSGTSWTTNQAPTTSVSGETVTISFGGAGAGVTITNRNATNLTVTATGSAVNGYPGSPYLVPQNGGLPILSNGATWDAIGPVAPNQAFTNASQSWGGTQTWGASLSAPNFQSGTTYALAATDCGGVIISTGASGFTITTLATLTIGCSVAIEQRGAGQVTIANGSGATLTTAVNSGGATHTRAQYSVIGLFVDANSGGSAANFNLSGDGS